MLFKCSFFCDTLKIQNYSFSGKHDKLRLKLKYINYFVICVTTESFSSTFHVSVSCKTRALPLTPLLFNNNQLCSR